MPAKRTKTKIKRRNNRPKLTPGKAVHVRPNLGFVVVGLVLILSTVVYRFYDIRRLSFAASADQLTITAHTQAPAKTIRLPKRFVTLDIVQTAIVDGVWQIHDTVANHLDISANPGEGGNIVIYGHNSTEVFGPLRWMSIGEEIEITGSDDVVHTYIVDKIVETNPDDITWILPKATETLTLYTCSGLLNTKRHIVIAHPI